LVPLVHGEVDDPAELVTVLRHEAEFAGDAIACFAGKLVLLGRDAADEEHGIAGRKAVRSQLGKFPQHLWRQPGRKLYRASRTAEELAQLRGPLRADILGDRPDAILFAFAPEDVAETGLTFALRPGIHAIAERAVAAARGGDRPNFVFGVGVDLAG